MAAKVAKKFLKASWPAIGGKGSVAKLTWERLGNVNNFIEPFANSAAMMLKNPHGGAHYETLNDLNHYVANYWRAVKAAPDEVAEYSDWPVSEVDLHARHRYLVASDDVTQFREKMLADPGYYDARFAGWWAWGSCLWIASGWCHERNTRGPSPSTKRNALGNERGMAGRPQLGDVRSRGRGVHANDNAATCEERSLWIREWMQTLSDRLRNVRVCCGEWSRVCSSKTTTTRLGLTGVFLDPPYRTHVAGKESRKKGLYATDEGSDLDKLQKEVLKYGLKHGDNRQMRIVICALKGEGYEPLAEAGWSEVPWTSAGYATSKKGQENAARERIWFSPYCLVPARDVYPLFANQEDDDDEE
jgi:DNA adenine methylase